MKNGGVYCLQDFRQTEDNAFKSTMSGFAYGKNARFYKKNGAGYTMGWGERDGNDIDFCVDDVNSGILFDVGCCDLY